MTVKIVKGLLGNNVGFREVRPATSNTRQTQYQPQIGLQSTSLSAQSRSLSEAVVNTIRGARSSAISTEKIREYREAQEVTGEVAEKIRDSEDGVKSHTGLDRMGGEHFSN